VKPRDFTANGCKMAVH